MGFTRMGVRYFRCDECGHQWSITLEDEILGSLSGRPKAPAADSRSPKQPAAALRYPTEE
jgi:hypothetical protein